MKLLNFRAEGRESVGALGTRGIVDLGARLGHEVTDALTFIRSGLMGPARSVAALDHSDYRLDDVQFLKPVGRDTRYFCIGVNYPDRNEEYKDGSERPKYPSLFMRSHTSLVAQGEPILRPRESEQLDYEGEIVVVIGTGGRRIKAAGRCPAARLRIHVRQRGLGPRLAQAFEVQRYTGQEFRPVRRHRSLHRDGGRGWDVAPLRVTTHVNGEERQNDTSDRMLFSIPYLISYLSPFCTLEPGDVVLSGTPTGAGARFDPPRYLVPGDVVRVEVSRVGVLSNTVVDDVD